jgi:uncharacterized protein (TIGR02466 family)
MELLDVFPTFIGIDNLENDLDFNLLKTECLSYIEKYDNIGVAKSNINGYHSNNINYNIIEKEFFEFKKLLHLICNKCSKATNKNMGITNCWININPKNTWNEKHSHPGSILSGVVYIDVPDDMNDYEGAFVIQRSRDHTDYGLNEHLDSMEDLKYTYDQIGFVPKIGNLFIFPSNLLHMVKAHNSDKDRISLSFNTQLSEG